MNIKPVNFGNEVRYGFQLCLTFTPVVVFSPIPRELLHRRELHALRCVLDQLALRPPCCVHASPSISEFCVSKGELKRTNRGVVSCLCTALCSTVFRHGGLLLSSVWFRIFECVRDRAWGKRDCQAKHRAHLQETTSRSFISLSHRVLCFQESWIIEFAWSSSDHSGF